MSGTIMLVDGPAGCGKTTFACGLPKPAAILETDPDGARWVREQFQEYSNERGLEAAKKQLTAWADMPPARVQSIVVDTWSYFWQLVVQHVLDEDTRKREFGTKNTYQAWGPAKISIRRLQDQLVRAKRLGKHVLLVAHTKEKTTQNEDKTVEKLGLTHTGEAFLNDLLDVGLRMVLDYKTGKMHIEAWKCRPQRDFRPLISGKLEVPQYGSQLMYAKIAAMIGQTPESDAAMDSEAEDRAALSAMKAAAAAGGLR